MVAFLILGGFVIGAVINAILTARLVTTQATAPSRELEAATWAAAHTRLIANLRDLIRIPSVNPPPAEAPDGELVAARHIAAILG